MCTAKVGVMAQYVLVVCFDIFFKAHNNKPLVLHPTDGALNQNGIQSEGE